MSVAPKTKVMLETVAQKLHAQGIRHGQRVALVVEPTADVLALIVACWSRGIVVLPVSTRYTPMQIQGVLQRFPCEAVIADRVFEGVTHTLSSFIAEQQDAFGGVLWDRLGFELDHEATVILTSGSTGSPKGILHALRQHYYSALGSHENIPFGPEDRWLVSLPLYHMSGLSLVMRALLLGGTLVFPKSDESLVAALQRTQATHVSVVPTQLQQLVGDEMPLSLKAVLVGGAPCSPALVSKANQRGLPVFLTYGSSEMASQVTTSRPGEAGVFSLSSGHLLRHRELQISTVGEILLQGDTRMLGYVEGNTLTTPWIEQGWFATGDLGRLDEAGRLFVHGRKDAMFISGGENIYPEEIERALLDLEGVTACMVVPMTDQEFGQRPVAFVQTDGPLPDPSHLDLPVEGFKYPQAIYAWPESLPRTFKPNRKHFQALLDNKE